ncbi:MAG TPA: RNA polymerase sigma factor [Planctomycetaceae bacterium]|jgi:RNA polymerase sigma-70 factor (ECF subfamily)|nr:RNA polymerase sigma factor [Planctomycetaceae bacterium]
MNGVEGNSLASGLDAIVASCRKGDSVAQRALYERFHRSVYGLAVRFVGRTEAADLTQEIFLRVFAGLDSFQGTACFSTWLYRVAINECLRHRRVTQISPDRLVCDPVSREIEPGQRLEDSEALEHALEQVDPSLRAIFLLRHVEALNYKQISDVLGIPISTAATRLARVRAELQRLLQGAELRS